MGEAAARIETTEAPRVVVASADAEWRDRMVAALEVDGIRVGVAGDAEEAFFEVRTSPTSLLLTDFELPGGSGPQLCEDLSADPAAPKLPCVMVLPALDRRRERRAKAAGAMSCLVRSRDGREELDAVLLLLGRTPSLPPMEDASEEEDCTVGADATQDEEDEPDVKKTLASRERIAVAALRAGAAANVNRTAESIGGAAQAALAQLEAELGDEDPPDPGGPSQMAGTREAIPAASVPLDSPDSQAAAAQLLTVLARCSRVASQAKDPRAALSAMLGAFVDGGGADVAAVWARAPEGWALLGHGGSSEKRLLGITGSGRRAQLLLRAAADPTPRVLPDSGSPRASAEVLREIDCKAGCLVAVVPGEAATLLVAWRAGAPGKLRIEAMAALAAQLAGAYRALAVQIQLRASREGLARLGETMDQALVVTDADGRVTQANPSAQRLFGFDPSRGFRVRIDDLMPGLDLTSEEWSGTGHAMEGDRFPVQVLTRRFVKNDPRRHLFHIVRSAAELEERRSLLAGLVNMDVQTGLPNNRGFLQAVEREMALAHRYEAWCSVLLVDVPELDGIERRIGLERGEAVISEVADALRRLTRRSDCLARIAGGRFGILLCRGSRDQAGGLAAKLYGALDSLPALGSGSVPSLSVTMGTGYFPDDGHSPEELVGKAVTAIAQARYRGQPWAYYDAYAPMATGNIPASAVPAASMDAPPSSPAVPRPSSPAVPRPSRPPARPKNVATDPSVEVSLWAGALDEPAAAAPLPSGRGARPEQERAPSQPVRRGRGPAAHEPLAPPRKQVARGWISSPPAAEPGRGPAAPFPAQGAPTSAMRRPHPRKAAAQAPTRAAPGPASRPASRPLPVARPAAGPPGAPGHASLPAPRPRPGPFTVDVGATAESLDVSGLDEVAGRGAIPAGVRQTPVIPADDEDDFDSLLDDVPVRRTHGRGGWAGGGESVDMSEIVLGDDGGEAGPGWVPPKSRRR